MAVAKRQGRSKEGPRTRVKTSEQTALLAKPNLHRAGPGGGKKHIKGGAKALSHRFSLPRVCTLFFLSLSLTLLLSSNKIEL